MLMEVHHSILKCSNTSQVLDLKPICSGDVELQAWLKASSIRQGYLDVQTNNSAEMQHSNHQTAMRITCTLLMLPALPFYSSDTTCWFLMILTLLIDKTSLYASSLFFQQSYPM
jgi:hypothetical protein